MDAYDTFDLIGDENLMQDAFKFGDLDPDPSCFSTREGDWDPFSSSASSTLTSTSNDPSIWSEELLNSIVSTEVVMECDATDQLQGREPQMGSDKDNNSGNSKSVMAIEGDQCSILSKEESLGGIIMCNSENPGVEMVIGGKSNAQTHEIERQMGPIEGDQCSIMSKGESPADVIVCSSENPGIEMVAGGESNVQTLEIEREIGSIEGDQCSMLSKGESQEDIIMSNSESLGVELVIGGESNVQTPEIGTEVDPIEYNSENLGGEMVTKEEIVIETPDIEVDSGCALHDPSPLGECSPETESVIDNLGIEMVAGGESNVQTLEIEREIGPIEGDQCSMLSKGESQEDIVMCNSESSGVELVIGGESNVQTLEIETEVDPIQYNPENLGGEMVTKEEIVIETPDIEVDSGCALHDPSPLGECSPETESVIDKLVGSCLTEMNNKTKEVEENITEENLTECNSENLRCEAVIGCGSVGPTQCNSVDIGSEMVSERGGSNESGEGDCDVGPRGKTFKSEIVTEGGSNAQPNERESHAGEIVDVPENLLDETLVERGIDDLSGLGDKQAGPASLSCENLSEDAEAVTIGDIKSQGYEVDCQVGPTELLCRYENGSNGFNKCIGTSQSSSLIQASTYEVHEVSQGGKNAQKEETVTAVSHTEKCFEQIGPSELQRSVDEKSCTGFKLELPSLETGVKDEYGRELSTSPAFSISEASVVEVDSRCASLDEGLLNNSSPATHLTNDKPVSAPAIISTHVLDNELVAPLGVETVPFSDCSSIVADTSARLMENIATTKEAEKRNTEEYASGDCGAHAPLKLTPGGCSSSIEPTEETTFEPGSVEKNDENEAALTETVLIVSNCKAENTASYKNLESDFGQRMHRDRTSEFLSTYVESEDAAVIEAVPESPVGVGGTKGLHNLNDGAATTGGLQATQQIQVNHVVSDSMEQSTEEIIVTFKNGTSVLEIPSSVTELVRQSDSLNEVIKEINVAETVPDLELHGPRDCIRELGDISRGVQSVEVKAVESLDRAINEEATANGNASENSIMNAVRVEDTRPEPSPVKLLSEHHMDASFVGRTQEIDSNSISFGCVEKKGDEKTIDHDVSAEAEVLNDATVNDVGLTLSPVEISSDCHADARPTESTPIQSDTLEQDTEDCALSVNPLLEKCSEENNAVNAPTELDLSVAVDDVGHRPLGAKINFEYSWDTSSIDDTPIQLENKMEDGKFHGNVLSEKSTEENSKSTPTEDDVELSFSPVKITPASDMDAGQIGHVLVVPVDEIKNVKDSDGRLDENRVEDKSSEAPEIINGTKIEDLVSSKTNDDTSVDFVPIQSDCVLDDRKSSELGVGQSSVQVGEYSGIITERSEPMIGSLVEKVRLDCESTPVDKQGGAHIGAISTECGLQYDMAVSLSHIDGNDSEVVDESDTLVISSETRSKLTSQDMVDLEEAENKPAEVSGTSLESHEASSADKMFQNSEIDDNGLASKLEDVLQGTTAEIKDPSSEYSLTKVNVTGVSVGDSSPNVELGMMKESQVKFIVSEILTKEDKNDSACHSACTSAERENIKAAYLSGTIGVISGEKMETQIKSTSQEMIELVEAEKKVAEVTGASLENAEASSSDELFHNSEMGDDGPATKLEDVLQCTLTDRKDPKSDLLDFGNGKRACSSSECSFPEENIAGVSMGVSSPDVELGSTKESQAKFINVEKMVREDKNSCESRSAHTLGTLVDDRTDDFERTGVSVSNVPSPSISEALMSGDTVNNMTCVEKNAKLPDLNMPQLATEPSQEPMTEAQKMQLRAQIFVYGSLVDGSIPTVAYMERSFGESDRCVWEPIWHAYSETLKTRNLLSSGKTPTLSGSQLKKTATRTVQNGTHFFSPLFDWSPSFSSNFQSSSWYLSPQSGTRNEPLQPFNIGFESEKRGRKRTSFADEVRSPAHNSVCRNANCIPATTNEFTSDFTVRTVPVSPVLTYARRSAIEKAGPTRAEHSCTLGSRVQLTPTCGDLPNTVVPGCSLGKQPNIVPICSLDRGSSVFSCAASPVFQPKSASGYYQFAPQSPSPVLIDKLSRQAESRAGASEILDQNPGLQKTVTTDRSSGTDPQDQVATAAVTVEAVTKAAAAARLASEAARLATEAALQAKLLADEAMGLMDPNPGMDLSMFQAGRELEMVATPAKVLEPKDKVHGSQAIVSSIREASRRRVKLASAASKRAENMDTILRAAEMAAEAVAQVGQVVMMGDPLPFCIADMVESIGGIHLRAVHSGEIDVSRGEEKVVDIGLATHRGAVVAQADEGLVKETISLSFGQTDLIGTGEDISIEIGGHVIKKGSHVEVTGDKKGHTRAWFGATVLNLKDGMAQIRYTDLPSCKEEWVPLETESGAAPMVRLAHPVTALKCDVDRKRRREDLSSYSWSVGDHVDARKKDGWWECIIAQKHADEANYTVHFPGESLVVGERNLRPSLFWKDGSWTEWARVKESSKFNKSDSPFEKRRRVDPTPHDVDTVIPKPNLYRSTKIPRAAHHQYARDGTSFSSAANRKSEECVSEPQRTGPRVCFGVPRPNKKTKFLEVAEVSRSKLGNDRTLLPNSTGREKQQKPPTKIPECSKESLISSRLKGLDGNLTKVRGKKPTTEPVTRKNALSSTGLEGQNGASHRKGVLNVGSGTSNRARKTEVTDAGSTEPRRSGRMVKPTPKLLEGVEEADHMMSKIPVAGSAKGPVSLKGSTRQPERRKAF